MNKKRTNLIFIFCSIVFLLSCQDKRTVTTPIKQVSSNTKNIVKKNKPDNHHIIKQLLLDKNCSDEYHDKSVVIIEFFCDKTPLKKGIYITDIDGTKYYHWYDEHFSQWFQLEGCADKTSCYYKVAVDSMGRVSELKYYFFVNLSSGYYRIKIEHGKLKVREKKVTNYPS